MNTKIFLVGLPGAGKTTLGLELAHHLGVQFVDLDQEIEKNARQTINAIFEEKGENHFRQLEHKYLINSIAELSNFVMATGGGTPCFFNNMELMKRSGLTIFIKTPLQIIKQRLKDDLDRPLMKSNTLEFLNESRKEWYEQADHTVRSLKELIKLVES